MSNYYYLTAQLPGLMYGMPSPFSYNDFLELASRFMSRGDLALLRSLRLTPPAKSRPSGSDVYDNWNSHERLLRLMLARVRATKMKQDVSAYPQPEQDDPAVAALARQAVACDSPLEAELLLDDERWKFLDSLKGLHMFDRDAVFLYALQLQMMERKAVFNESEGFASYRSIYNKILDISGDDK